MRTLSLALSMALIAAIQNTHAASYFTLTSTSIADGARIPVRFGADDKQRVDYFQTYYKVNWLNPALYDITINTARLDNQAAVEVIKEAQSRFSQT